MISFNSAHAMPANQEQAQAAEGSGQSFFTRLREGVTSGALSLLGRITSVVSAPSVEPQTGPSVPTNIYLADGSVLPVTAAMRAPAPPPPIETMPTHLPTDPSEPSPSLLSRVGSALADAALELTSQAIDLTTDLQDAHAPEQGALGVRPFLSDDSMLRFSNYLPEHRRPDPGPLRDTIDMVAPTVLSALIFHPAPAAMVLTAMAADSMLGDDIEELERANQAQENAAQQAENRHRQMLMDALPRFVAEDEDDQAPMGAAAAEEGLRALIQRGAGYRFTNYLPQAIRPRPGPLQDTLDTVAPVALSAYMAWLANPEAVGEIVDVGAGLLGSAAEYIYGVYTRLQGTNHDNLDAGADFVAACEEYLAFSYKDCLRVMENCAGVTNRHVRETQACGFLRPDYRTERERQAEDAAQERERLLVLSFERQRDQRLDREETEQVCSEITFVEKKYKENKK